MNPNRVPNYPLSNPPLWNLDRRGRAERDAKTEIVWARQRPALRIYHVARQPTLHWTVVLLMGLAIGMLGALIIVGVAR